MLNGDANVNANVYADDAANVNAYDHVLLICFPMVLAFLNGNTLSARSAGYTRTGLFR